MNELEKWFRQTTQTQQNALAQYAGTTRGNLLQMVYGNRVASAEMAARLEHSAKRLIGKKYAVPTLDRTKLCPACGACELAKGCKK